MVQTFEDIFNDLENLVAFDDHKRQRRGRKFEELILDIFEYHKILLRRSFHTDDEKAEQIDGSVEFGNQIALVEVKWREESDVAASDLYAFSGKVENKFTGTIGIFISRKKLSKNFLHGLNKGRRQCVIVIHGNDIHDIIKEDFPLDQYLLEARRQLSTDNITHFSTKRFLEEFHSKPNEVKSGASLRPECKLILSKVISKEIVDTNSLLIDIESECADKDKLFILEYLLAEIKNLNFERITRPSIERNHRILTVVDRLLEDSGLARKSWKTFAKNFQTDPHKYIRESIISHYLPVVEALDAKDFRVFADALLNAWNSVFNTWNSWPLENVLSEITERVWNKLDQEIQDNLYSFIFEIASDTQRKDNFPQKQFARLRLQRDVKEDNNAVLKKVYDWISEKIESEKEKYAGLKSGRKMDIDRNASFFAESYDRLREYIMIAEDEWERKIKKLYKQVYGSS
jgi:hypothetical protein